MAGHQELDFEAAIETHLLAHGWHQGSPFDWDVSLGLDPRQLADFVQTSQPKEWAKLEAAYTPAHVQTRFAQRVAAEIDSRGTIDVLRKGVRDKGAAITLAFFRPTHALTPELTKAYAENRCLVYRQVHHSESNGKQSLDVLLALNGIPVATAELKNPFTGQTAEHALAQYRDPAQRNPRDRIFARRCVAHFAVDPNLAFVTTALDGPSTVFLPFNQGSNGPGVDGGKGNALNPNGHRTAYLWEQVWQRDHWLDLLHRYAQETAPGKGGSRKVLFPRYHQWDLVRRLVDHAAVHGSGRSYLAQHSAGSGKSNSIAWLAHRLADLHTPSDARDLAADSALMPNELVFSKVVVITDRRVLDRQLQATISGFDHVAGMLQRIDTDSAQLRDALLDAKTKIIITTLQKFPFIGAVDLGGRRVAVIVDEAHSSQSGEAAKASKAALAGVQAAKDAADADAQDPDDTDPQDELADYLATLEASATARGQQQNLSVFAFTATPKGKTLQLFGTRVVDEVTGAASYKPFHVYSMRQAVEEGFILDVLANYVTYRRYYRLANGLTSEDPEVDKGKAGAALARYVDLHVSNLDQKAEIIVEHFRTVTAKKIGGQAKAMVVTRSRLHAVRYFQALQRYVTSKGITGVRPLVAFSGKIVDKDDPTQTEHTEASLNGFPDSQTTKEFEARFEVLIVAEKYQTGFDQPLLHTMYVDKKLEGVKAVQTLSRLNRTHPGKGDTFVLDFVNTAEDMREQFAPFFQSTWTEETDPNLLYNLDQRLRDFAVIDPTEQRTAVTAFLMAAGVHGAVHGIISSSVDPAVVRYEALSEADQEDFRTTLTSFARAYAFLGQVTPYTEPDLEERFYYAKLLAEALPRPDRDSGGIDLGDTALQFLGHEAGVVTSGSVTAGESDGMIETFSGEGRGSNVDPVMARLSEIIDSFNTQFAFDLQYADGLLLFVELPAHMAADPAVQKLAKDNSAEQFGLTVKEDDVAAGIFERQEAGDRLLKLFTEDKAFSKQAMQHIREAVYQAALAMGTA